MLGQDVIHSEHPVQRSGLMNRAIGIYPMFGKRSKNVKNYY